jgi:Transmembrane secretion effector
MSPALGGLLIPLIGPNFVFALNAACFLVVILAILRWKRATGQARLPLESGFRRGRWLLVGCELLSLLHFQICKSPQVSLIHVGDSPEFEPITSPMQNIIAVLRETLRGCIAARFQRPDKQVDNMFVTLVDERPLRPGHLYNPNDLRSSGTRGR